MGMSPPTPLGVSTGQATCTLERTTTVQNSEDNNVWPRVGVAVTGDDLPAREVTGINYPRI